MNSSPCLCNDSRNTDGASDSLLGIKEDIRARAIALGASRCGFAKAEPVESVVAERYQSWIAQGRHGDMEYCERYTAERSDPRLLLEGASTVISCAFCYNYGQHPRRLVSRYALGKDYHWIVKDRLSQLGDYICQRYGGQVRTLVDTAPMHERYWAQKAGVGFVGLNNQLIVPGAGSYFFLGELLWTGTLAPDEPCQEHCKRCGACVQACPGKALDGKGGCDASRCLSYLTIESKQPVDWLTFSGKVDCIYGCDVCQEVCPHNTDAQTALIPEFAPREAVMELTVESIAQMGSGAYRRLVAESAMRRVPLRKLKVNLGLIETTL